MLSDITNKVGQSLEDVIGTGLRGADFDFENVETLGLLQRGTTILPGADFDRDYLRNLQREGKYIPLQGVYSFEWQSEEDQVETSDSKGQETVTRKGLYKLQAMFRNGLYQQKVLDSLEGFRRWDLILIDEDGNILHNTPTNGGLSGFSTGRFSVSPITFKNGSNSLKTMIVAQFVRSSQFNKTLGFITAEENSFDINEVEGINEVKTSIPTAPSAGTAITVKTVLDKDGCTFIGGLAETNFLVKVDGTTVAVSGIASDATAQTYTLTVPAISLGQAVEVSLYDSVKPSSVIQVGTAPDDILYKGKPATTVVVA